MDSLISERRLICEIRSFTAAKSRAVHNKPIRDFSKWCPAQTARTCRGGPPWPPQGGQLGHKREPCPKPPGLPPGNTSRSSEQIQKLIHGETRMADQGSKRANGEFLVFEELRDSREPRP